MTKTFIIIEPDPIVAMDVEGLLVTHFPDARAVAGTSLGDVGAVIHTCGPGFTLVVRGTLVTDGGDFARVVKEAATRGAQIVVIGDPAAFDFPALFIDVPFTTEMVLEVVGGGADGDGPEVV